MKVKVFRRTGFFRNDNEVVICDRVSYMVEDEIFTGYIGEKVSAYITDATGYNVLSAIYEAFKNE
jgi:hypothetical protein